MGDTFKFKPMNSRVSEDRPLEPSLIDQFKEAFRPTEERVELERQRDAANALRRSKTKNTTPQTSDD